jgi:hypothetical protein
MMLNFKNRFTRDIIVKIGLWDFGNYDLIFGVVVSLTSSTNDETIGN